MLPAWPPRVAGPASVPSAPGLEPLRPWTPFEPGVPETSSLTQRALIACCVGVCGRCEWALGVIAARI